MVKPGSEWTLRGSVFAAMAAAAGAVWLAFMPSMQGLRGEARRAAAGLHEARVLLAKKPALQSEWDAKKSFFNTGLEPDVALNAWVKDLLTLAQSQGLILEKLEPAGIQKGPGGKSLTVYLSFKADMARFLRFMYQLGERDPLSRVDSFGVRQEEGSRSLAFELLLGKAAK